MTRDNIPPIAEEIIIEQQTVQELREQITALQNELAEQKKHADKMDDLAWESLKAKEKLEKELGEEKREKERIQKELEAKNQIIDDLQKEKEKGWWDKWIEDPNEKYVENSFGVTGVKGWKNEPLQMALAKWMFAGSVETNICLLEAKTMFGDVKIPFDNHPFYQLKDFSRLRSIFRLQEEDDMDLRKAKQMIKHISEYYKWI